jgi:hypothetical protein
MRFVTRWVALLLLTGVFCAERPGLWAKSPVLPIPTPRQGSSVLAPKSGVPKTPLLTPNSKTGSKKRSWFPFGNRNKKVATR